jgi:hypothetical protein
MIQTIVPPGTADIVDYFNIVNLSNKTLSLSGTAPLDRALQQLVASNEMDGVQLSLRIQGDRDRLHQRFAYLALVFCAGKEEELWWFADPNECEWFGISCLDGNTVKGHHLG